MKQPALVIIKPEGIARGLVGNILNKFAQAELEIIALKVAEAHRRLVEEHYQHLKRQPFFESVVDHLMGKIHKQKKIILIVYYGKDAIRRCRTIAGATNPEEADPRSIRGAYGRVTTKGLYENLVHVSSDQKETKREIKLWLKPDDILKELYPSKTTLKQSSKQKEWV